MLLLGMAKYPMQSAKEIATRVMRMPRLPDYIKSRGNYAYIREQGMVGLVIYEFESVKTDEAIDEISKAYWQGNAPGYH